MPRPNHARITKCLADLRTYAANLPATVDWAMPPGYVFVEGVDEHCAVGTPLKPVRDMIDNILHTFDELQRAMGEKYPRHELFLQGKCCDECGHK